MFKQHDKVRFGDMSGVVVTDKGKPEAPIQAIFPQQKVVLGFRSTGDFFTFDGGPRLEIVKPNIFKRGALYVANLLRPARPLDSDKPQA